MCDCTTVEPAAFIMTALNLQLRHDFELALTYVISLSELFHPLIFSAALYARSHQDFAKGSNLLINKKSKALSRITWNQYVGCGVTTGHTGISVHDCSWIYGVNRGLSYRPSWGAELLHQQTLKEILQMLYLFQEWKIVNFYTFYFWKFIPWPHWSQKVKFILCNLCGLYMNVLEPNTVHVF